MGSKKKNGRAKASSSDVSVQGSKDAVGGGAESESGGRFSYFLVMVLSFFWKRLVGEEAHSL